MPTLARTALLLRRAGADAAAERRDSRTRFSERANSIVVCGFISIPLSIEAAVSQHLLQRTPFEKLVVTPVEEPVLLKGV
ncbi:MAG: hypothetical protein ACR2P2_11435 [Nakamurella sp.]